MTLVVWRFVTILLAAVAMGAALCHVLEMPPKLGYDAELYLTLHRTLYENYGRFAGPAEVVSVLASLGLAWWLRGRGRVAWLTTAGAACLLAAHATFWVVVQPANMTMLAWSLDAIPADWTRWRDRWEVGHAVRAALMLGGVASLVLSTLVEARRAAPRSEARPSPAALSR